MQGGLAASYINMSEAEAVDLAGNRFGVSGRASRLATEKDDTFRITPADGPRFILKVANPSENVAEIDLQVQLLDHIAASAPDLPVPRVIGNDAGEQHFSHQDRAGQHRQVRMMSYLEGQPLSEVPSTSSGREQIGKLLARLRLAMADFRHPADSRVLAWDIKHLLTLDSLLDGIAVEQPIGRPEQRRAAFDQLPAAVAQPFCGGGIERVDHFSALGTDDGIHGIVPLIEGRGWAMR